MTAEDPGPWPVYGMMVNTPVPVGSGTVEFPIMTALTRDVESSGIVEVVAFRAITIVPIVTVVVSVRVLLGVIWLKERSVLAQFIGIAFCWVVEGFGGRGGNFMYSYSCQLRCCRRYGRTRLRGGRRWCHDW